MSLLLTDYEQVFDQWATNNPKHGFKHLLKVNNKDYKTKALLCSKLTLNRSIQYQ